MTRLATHQFAREAERAPVQKKEDEAAPAPLQFLLGQEAEMGPSAAAAQRGQGPVQFSGQQLAQNALRGEVAEIAGRVVQPNEGALAQFVTDVANVIQACGDCGMANEGTQLAQAGPSARTSRDCFGSASGVGLGDATAYLTLVDLAMSSAEGNANLPLVLTALTEIKTNILAAVGVTNPTTEDNMNQGGVRAMLAGNAQVLSGHGFTTLKADIDAVIGDLNQAAQAEASPLSASEGSLSSVYSKIVSAKGKVASRSFEIIHDRLDDLAKRAQGYQAVFTCYAAVDFADFSAKEQSVVLLSGALEADAGDPMFLSLGPNASKAGFEANKASFKAADDAVKKVTDTFTRPRASASLQIDLDLSAPAIEAIAAFFPNAIGGLNESCTKGAQLVELLKNVETIVADPPEIDPAALDTVVPLGETSSEEPTDLALVEELKSLSLAAGTSWVRGQMAAVGQFTPSAITDGAVEALFAQVYGKDAETKRKELEKSKPDALRKALQAQGAGNTIQMIPYLGVLGIPVSMVGKFLEKRAKSQRVPQAVVAALAEGVQAGVMAFLTGATGLSAIGIIVGGLDAHAAFNQAAEEQPGSDGMAMVPLETAKNTCQAIIDQLTELQARFTAGAFTAPESLATLMGKYTQDMAKIEANYMQMVINLDLLAGQDGGVSGT